MQNLIYDEAPYDILYYDSNLDVYRNDQFAGWQNMPANGTPLFSSGDSVLNYTLLTRRHRAAAGDTRGRGRLRLRRLSQPPRRRRRPRPARHRVGLVDEQQRIEHRPCCSPWWRRRRRGRRRPRLVPTSSDDQRRGRVAAHRRMKRRRRGSRSSRPPPDHPEALASERSLHRAQGCSGRCVTIVAIVLLNFVLFRMMPGSPERADEEPAPHPGVRGAELRARAGLDKPLLPRPAGRLHRHRRRQGDLGYSIKYRGQPVTEVVLEAVGPDRAADRARARRSRSWSGCGSAPDRAGDAAAASTGSATASASSSTRCRTS